MKSVIFAISLVLVCAGVQGCRNREPRSATRPGGGDASSLPVVVPEELGFRYPATRWRLATFEQLDRATLWVGHIAIRHDHSQVELFRPPGWRPDAPNPARSAAEALALAEKVWAQIAAKPQDFERLARLYSEDIVSRDEGGMLGGVRATQLADTDFLDVLAALKPGEVSRPFQTPYGFHIVKRYPPPPDERVAGERIVIGYEGVFGLQSPSHRTRAEALQLAKEIAAKARAEARKEPASFSALVERHSDNFDRANHGDMGVYSTRDPAYLPVEIHHLARIGVGEVTGPIDSRFGFEILRRTEALPRTEYAMTAIHLSSPDDAPNPDVARAGALKLAEEVLRQVKAGPGRFEELQRKYCCDRVRRWTKGRGEAEWTQTLDRLSFGQIADEPTLNGLGYMIMKRLDPATLPPEPPRQWEVPNPSEPDYDKIARTSDGAQLALAARAFARDARASSLFSPEAAQTTTNTIDQLAAYLEQNQGDQQAVHATLVSTLGSLQAALGPEQFGRLEAFGRRWIIRQMMPPGSVD